MHRATGVFLSLVATPLLLWWLVALGNGEDAYQSMGSFLSGALGSLLAVACTFSLSFHFLNGIRHLIWDSGHMLDIENVYRSGWGVLVGSLALSALMLGFWL